VLVNAKAQQARSQDGAQGDGQWHRKHTADVAGQPVAGKGEKVE